MVVKSTKIVIYFWIPGFNYATNSPLPQGGQRSGMPTPPKQAAFLPQEDIDANDNIPHVEGCVNEPHMGEVENYFVNESGQNIHNPEGYATNTEIQQTRDIFSSLAEL